MNLVDAKLSSGTPYVMLEVSREEAIQIARTILDQIDNDSSNTGRIEFSTNKGYFSLAVNLDSKEQQLRKKIQELDGIIKSFMSRGYNDYQGSARVANKVKTKNKKRK